MRSCCCLLGLVFLTGLPAFPDITNVSVNGMISDSGTVECINCPGDGGASASVGNTSTSPGFFSNSQTGSFTFGEITIAALESTAVTATSFDVDLQDSASVNGVPSVTAQFTLSHSYTLAFTLPAESVIHLTGFNTQLSGGPPPPDFLYGPNNFAFAIPFSTFDNTLTLAPGDYQLVSSEHVSSGFTCGLGCTNQSFTTELSLHADVTPFAAVPEPSSIFVILASLVAVIFAARRRSRGYSRSR